MPHARAIHFDNLNDAFEYDDGSLFWKVKTNDKIHVGDRAGGLTINGYRQIMINNKHRKEHHLIWEMFNGEIPNGFCIDHKDRNRLNNRIGNLRLATGSQNNSNSKKYKNNTSGFKGVFFNAQCKKWEAQIYIDHRKKYLGRYSKAELAHEAVIKGSIKYHGEFSNF